MVNDLLVVEKEEYSGPHCRNHHSGQRNVPLQLIVLAAVTTFRIQVTVVMFDNTAAL